MRASSEARAIKRATDAALALRCRLAEDVIVLAKQISRAPLSDGQTQNVLKLHGLWDELARLEGFLQVLTGTPPEEAGV